MPNDTWPKNDGKRPIQAAVEPEKDPKKVAIENVCPFLGLATTLFARKSTAAEMLQGAPPETPMLGAQFTPCIEAKCRMYDAESKICLVREGLAAAVEMAKTPFRRGLETKGVV